MHIYFISTLLVALAEMGDRTQLLAVMLASRYRKPWQILAGIFVATIANHALAAFAGFYLASMLQATWFHYLIALSFIAMAVWALIPDRADEERAGSARLGVFLTTAVSFFLVEMGDKTQIATAVLAARYDALVAVIAGTTLGMLIADVPVVFAGKLAADRIPFKAVRTAAALLFAAMGAWVLYAGIPAA